MMVSPRFDAIAICEAVLDDLNCAISGLPKFRFHWLSSAPPEVRKGFKEHWIAAAFLGGRERQSLEQEYGRHRPIVLSDDWLAVSRSAEWIELVALHEAAHFIAHDIDPDAPSHGFLWGRCFTALAGIIGLDEIERFEAPEHILVCARSELNSQLRADGCKHYQEWSSRMAFQQHAVLSCLDAQMLSPVSIR